MQKELKSYQINGHVAALSLENVFYIPFFVVLLDGRECFAGKDRAAAIDALDAACKSAMEAR